MTVTRDHTQVDGQAAGVVGIAAGRALGLRNLLRAGMSQTELPEPGSLEAGITLGGAEGGGGPRRGCVAFTGWAPQGVCGIYWVGPAGGVWHSLTP